ncbi:MAG: hypothetical protein J5J00_01675 [Deltaproteobacteria bacterium]|nr:hypothetical protein [Deltaproteobacteria bacterium]
MRSLLLFVICPWVTACGKFAPPIPPEYVAPRAVKELQVATDVNGVNFSWQAPDLEVQGKPLRFIDGYQIVRKEMERKEQLLDDDIEYQKIASIDDTHLVELDKLKEVAIAENRPTRRVSVPAEMKQFQYSDKNVQPGKLYAYKIIPVNQGGVEGEVENIIRVNFRGDASEITFIQESDFEEEIFLDVEP